MAERPILALTIIQPWAELIVRGPKRYENRTWEPPRTLVGGYLAIHAGKAVDGDSWGGAIDTARDAHLVATLPVLAGLMALPAPEPGDRFARQRERRYVERACPYSAIVGVARLAGVARAMPVPHDPWWFGPVGWRLDDVVAFDPVPCRGAQGLWSLAPETLTVVRERYHAAKGARS